MMQHDHAPVGMLFYEVVRHLMSSDVMCRTTTTTTVVI